MKKFSFSLILGFLFVFLLSAELFDQLSISILPGLNSSLTDSAVMLDTGGKVQLDLGFLPGSIPFLSVNGEAGFTYMPIIPLDSVSLYNLGIGAGFRIMSEKRFNFDVDTAVGFYYGIINDGSNNSAGNFYAWVGGGASFNFNSKFGLRLQADYTYAHQYDSSITVSFGPRFFFPLGEEKETFYDPAIQLLSGVEYFDVLPLLFKYYYDHPVGNAIIENKSSSRISDIYLSLFVEKYMTDPKVCSFGEELGPGESLTVDLFSLFDDAVLEITNNTNFHLFLLNIIYNLKY